jgi:hypothetical protein
MARFHAHKEMNEELIALTSVIFAGVLSAILASKIICIIFTLVSRFLINAIVSLPKFAKLSMKAISSKSLKLKKE